MYRAIFYFGLVVGFLSLLGLGLPHDVSALTFLLPSGWGAVAALIGSVMLLYFSVAAGLRRARLKVLFGIVGAVLALAGTLGFFAPTFFGLFGDFVRAANLAVVFLLGLGFMLAGIEEARPALIDERQQLRELGATLHLGVLELHRHRHEPAR